MLAVRSRLRGSVASAPSLLALTGRAITRRGLPFALAGLAASVAVAVPLATAPSASAAEPVTVANHTFENDNTHGWAPRADETVAVSTAAAHSGTGSLLTSGRTRTWEGPTLDVLDTMDKGVRYTLSVGCASRPAAAPRRRG